MTGRAARPPAIAGTRTPDLGDTPRLLWWSQRGFWHGMRHGSATGRVLSAILTVAWWPCFPLLLACYVWLLRRPHARYYLSPSRDAVLAIVATKDGWHIEDHVSARPGVGYGRALRKRVVPEVRAAADSTGITLYGTAATQRLADLYRAELPGVVEVGRGLLRGRRLIRIPQVPGPCSKR